MFSKNIKKNNRQNLLIITPFFHPHLGGVEKHVFKTSLIFQKKGYKLKIIAQKHNASLANQDKINGLDVYRFSFPRIKIFGLFVIWITFLRRFFSFFYQADIVHVHDVMLWCLPLRLLFPRKKFILTMHGWEGVYPIPKKNIWLKKLSSRLANRIFCVGAYISKYYGVSCDQTIEGGVDQDLIGSHFSKNPNPVKIVFLGRLRQDTGLLEFLDAWKKLSSIERKSFHLTFVGDGDLKAVCKKYGEVRGWLSENKVKEQLKSSSICIASGYLSTLEALAAGCIVLAIGHNGIKKDYWQMSEVGSKVKIVENYNQVVKFLKQSKLLVKNYNPSSNLAWLKQKTWQEIAELYLESYSL